MKKLSLMLLALMTAGFALAGNYDGVMPEAVPSGVNGQTVAASVNAPSEPLRTAETPVPTITIENYGYYVVVSVDGEGQLTGQILINGDVYEEFSAAEHYECTIESVFDILQEIWVYASAQLLGADPSPTVSHSCYLDPIPKPVMPTPEISYTENDSSLCIVIDGNGILCGSIVIDGDIVMQFEEYEHFEYTVEKLYDVSQIVEVIVRAQADGYDPSEEVHEYYLIEPMPRPIAESPEISADLSGTVLIITIVSDGEVSGKIEINGYEVTQFCAIGPFQYSVEMTGETQDIYIEAWADKPGYQTSEVVTYTYELPPLPDAPWPIADLHLTDSQGIFIVTGEGYLILPETLDLKDGLSFPGLCGLQGHRRGLYDNAY